MKNLRTAVLIATAALLMGALNLIAEDDLQYRTECLQQVNYFKDGNFDENYLPRCIHNKANAERTKQKLKEVRSIDSEGMSPQLGLATSSLVGF